MGKPGPKPKPNEIKALHGNPGKRTINNDAPNIQKPRKILPPPRHLGPVAKKEWRRIAKELHAIGILTKIDIMALSAYCSAYELWVDAYEQVQKRGSVVKTSGGNIIQNPYLSVANRQQAEMRKWLVEFGMTPSSRSSLKIEKKEKQKSALELLLEQRAAAGKTPVERVK